MKAIAANELRAVEGGVKYRTFCGKIYNDSTPWNVIVWHSHYNVCSKCQYANRRYGRWFTFNTRSAQKAAWGFSWV